MTARLYERKGVYHVIISYKDEFGKWCQTSRTTGLAVKNNMRKAEKKQAEILEEFKRGYNNRICNVDSGILFSDFLSIWLEMIKHRVKENTFHLYKLNVETHIKPYFEKRKILLRELHQRDLQAFINQKLNDVSPNTVLKYHQHIYSTLRYALRLDLVEYNVADRVELPRKNKFVPKCYEPEEVNQLIRVSKNEPIESAVILAVYYGLRREEVLGLRYKDVDFSNDTIKIRHTVVLVGSKPKYEDSTKTSSSERTLPLKPEIKEYLKKLQIQQEEEKWLFGDNYFVSDYICRRSNGELLNPTYLTHYFKKMLEKNNMRHIRFHDLRHSNASNLISMGCEIKELQDWLGHGSISTTADIYAKLSFNGKKRLADKVRYEM